MIMPLSSLCPCHFACHMVVSKARCFMSLCSTTLGPSRYATCPYTSFLASQQRSIIDFGFASCSLWCARFISLLASSVDAAALFCASAFSSSVILATFLAEACKSLKLWPSYGRFVGQIFCHDQGARHGPETTLNTRLDIGFLRSLF